MLLWDAHTRLWGFLTHDTRRGAVGGERRGGGGCDLSEAHTQVWPWQLAIAVLGRTVKALPPATRGELQQEETLHHGGVTLMYSIRFSYHVKERIKRKCLEKGMPSRGVMDWGIPNLEKMCKGRHDGWE